MAYFDSGSTTVSEQAIIEAFFTELSCFNFDKAKDIVDKERELLKNGSSGNSVNIIWLSLASALSLLAIMEKNYTSLAFLTTKRFLRSDNSLKSQYETLKLDLQRLGEVSKSSSSLGTPNSSASSTPTSLKGFFASSPVFPAVLLDTESLNHQDRLLIHIGGQLASFIMARLDIIDFYEKLYISASNRFMKFDELHSHIKEIINRSQKQFHHPLLAPIKTVFNLETEILCMLIETQIQVAQWKFFPALMNLYEANCKLGSWSAMFNQKETKKLLFQKPVVTPPLYQWLVKFKGHLVSKFTLYFYEVLSKQTTSQEIKNMCAKAPSDHHQKIVSFQKKYDAIYISLIFETRYNDNLHFGYHHPDRTINPPKGLDSFPAIFSYPTKPVSHWPNILMIMSNRAEELSNTDRVVCFFDKRVKATYFVSRIEPGMTFVVIFGSQKSDKDSNVILFMQELTSQLRGNKIFTNLKPGSK
ncbi:KICSTOR complex protein C12orf66 [Nymphon striatum]|nr:KICSTOR complex protein C12orf66 [Nymphon striatum]